MRITLLALAGALLAAGAPSEYQVKAVFLYNFSQFVEWPAAAFADAGAPFAICVLGSDPFGTHLDEVVKDEKAGGRPMVARRLASAGDSSGCHIVYVSASESANLARVLEDLEGRHVLTVSDMEAFTSRGGMVRLYTDRSRIKLRIGLGAATAAGLSISSKLLRLAEIVPQGDT